jgi:hypothetical protein
MTRFDSSSCRTRRQVVKMLGLTGAAALTSWDFLIAQTPKRGKIDVHSHTYPPGQANGKAAAWKWLLRFLRSLEPTNVVIGGINCD